MMMIEIRLREQIHSTPRKVNGVKREDKQDAWSDGQA